MLVLVSNLLPLTLQEDDDDEEEQMMMFFLQSLASGVEEEELDTFIVSMTGLGLLFAVCDDDDCFVGVETGMLLVGVDDDDVLRKLTSLLFLLLIPSLPSSFGRFLFCPEEVEDTDVKVSSDVNFGRNLLDLNRLVLSSLAFFSFSSVDVLLMIVVDETGFMSEDEGSTARPS